MASYSLVIKKSAEKELRSVPNTDLSRLVDRMQSLTVNPRLHGAETLSGEDTYRIRQGGWRIIYSIDDSARLVDIVNIGHRRDVYR